MKANDVPRPKDGVLFRELDDGCVLYDPKNEKVHSLNVTAGFVWCLMDGERTLKAIASEICSQCDVDHDVVLQDVIDTAGEFANQGLIE